MTSKCKSFTVSYTFKVRHLQLHKCGGDLTFTWSVNEFAITQHVYRKP